MPVYKDKYRGTYYVVINHRVNGKNKPIFKRGFGTKREAVQFEKDAILEGKYTHTSGTFRDMLLEQCSYNDLADNTAKEKIRAAEMYFPLIDKQIEKITKQDLVKWRDSLKGNTEIVNSTKNSFIGEVKSVFNYAEKIYELPNRSKILTRFKETSDDVKEMAVWNPEQFNQFIDCLDHPVYRAYFTLLFWTGMRRSEATALCKQDIDLENRTISVNKNITRTKPRTFKPLKTKGSKRVIPVDSVTMEMLRPLYEIADPFIFGTYRPLVDSVIYKTWVTTVKKAGLPYITIHGLRHSHASWLIGNGVNIVAVSKRLGHTNIQQTLTTYTHLLESNSAEMMEKIEKFRNV